MHKTGMDPFARQNALLSLFIALPAPIVTAMVTFGPSSVDSAHPGWLDSFCIPFSLVILMISSAFFFFALTRKSFIYFLAIQISFTMIAVVASIFAALYIHRDFYTATFQYILLFPVSLIIYIAERKDKALPKTIFPVISTSGFALATIYAQWILMMGYAIATRAEPRPFESIAYNIYNLILAFLLLFAAQSIKRAGYCTMITSSDTLIVNSRDITTVAGPKKTLLINAFASAPNRSLRCSDLQKILHPATFDERGLCFSCVDESRKAAMCSQYRTTYNSILETKKLLEFLGVGTITSGDNRRNILQDGWKLVLFENVRVETKK
jgi:hypothetical protein